MAFGVQFKEGGLDVDSNTPISSLVERRRCIDGLGLLGGGVGGGGEGIMESSGETCIMWISGVVWYVYGEASW